MRVKDIVVLRNEKTTDTSRRYIGLENITSWDARFVETTSETEGTNNIFYPNDILFGKLRPYLAKGYIPKYEGICSTEFFVMSCKSGVLPHYLLYVFLSHSVIDFIKNQVAGVKMPRTNWDEFGNLNIDLPSLSVQQKIVDYLDEKTSAIDTKVELLEKKKDAYARLKKAMINRAVTRGLDEHVKLKDSGVEWIGMIPEHWEVKRFKDVFRKYSTGFTPESKNLDNFSDNEEFTWVTIADMTTRVVGISSLNLSEKAIKDNLPELTIKGSLMFSFKLTIGKTAFAEKDLYTNEAIVSIPPHRNVDLVYFYYTVPMICMNNATENIYGAKILNQKIIANMIFALPPYEEQQAIAAYLDEKCAKIDAAIANIDKQTDALKRLKRSLINEVISGKRMIE